MFKIKKIYKPIKGDKRIRTKAYALIYAILVLVLIGVFSSVYLNMYYSNEHRKSMVFLQQDLRNDTKLALLEFLNLETLESGNFQYDKSPLSKFTIKIKPWGVFDRISITGERQTFKENYSVLTGYEIKTPEMPSLYFENRDVLKIGGSTLITKKANVPQKGVERAYINSKGKTRSKLIDGKVERFSRKSKSIMSTIDVLQLEPGIGTEINTGRVIPYEPDKNYYNSFANEVLILDVGSSGIVNSKIKGHIKIIANDSIAITNQASLNQVQIISPKIRIETNFKGNAQCFASQFIYVEKGVELSYPSVLFLHADSINSGIILDEHSKIEGVVVAFKNKYERSLNPQVEFRKTSKIVGQVITHQLNTQPSGILYGSLFLNTMFLKTKSSIYTNHLLDTEININKLPEERLGVNLQDYSGKQRIINWLDHRTL